MVDRQNIVVGVSGGVSVDSRELVQAEAIKQELGGDLVESPEAGGDEEAEVDDAPPGIPYDEWDFRRRRYREGWCTVYPGRAQAGEAAGAAWASDALGRHRRLQRELRRRLERYRAGLRPEA